MSIRRPTRFGGVALQFLLSTAACTSAGAQSTTLRQRADAREQAVPDTLPAYHQIRGTSRDRSALIAAVIDALHGRMAFPPPLVVNSFKREDRTVTIDMKADSLPRIRWRNGGGTVRILADGRRVIVRRHN